MGYVITGAFVSFVVLVLTTRFLKFSSEGDFKKCDNCDNLVFLDGKAMCFKFTPPHPIQNPLKPNCEVSDEKA